MNRQQQGAHAEALARDYLEASGYSFIEANFTRRVGEIDLIMRSPANPPSPQSFVFVEVRYRRSAGYGGALASIDWKKQRKMLRVANAWLQKNATSRDAARIDVITIEPQSIHHGLAASRTVAAELWRGHHLLWLQNAVESAT